MSQTPVGVSFWRIVRDQVLGGKSERTAQIVIQAAKRQILAERNAKRKPRYGSYELDEGFLNYARRVVRESQSHEAEKIGLEKKYKKIREDYTHRIALIENQRKASLQKLARGAPASYRKMFSSPTAMIDHLVDMLNKR